MDSTPTTSDRCGCGAELPSVTVMGYTLTLPRCWNCQQTWLEEDETSDRERARQALYGRAGLRGRLLNRTLASYREKVENDPALALAQAWLDTPSDDDGIVRRPNLILFGSIGAGKSGLAAAMVRELCDRTVAKYPPLEIPHTPPALFVLWRDVLADMRAAFASGEYDPALLSERARTVPVLVLDDLGAERPTDWAREELATLIQARYDKRLPIIVTTNYNGAELAARLGHDDPIIGKRILSRLLDGAQTRGFQGEDLRRKVAA